MSSPRTDSRNQRAAVESGARSGRSVAALLLACVALGALLYVLWSLVQRSPLGGKEARTQTRVAVEVERALRPTAPRPEVRDPERVSNADGPAGEPVATSATPELATVSGRLTIDGLAPDGGRVRLRAVDASWEAAAVLDYEGRFGFTAVPARELTLAFELLDLEPLDARQLLLPEVGVRPQPGQAEDLQLDWKTRQVNVRVVSDAPEGCRARVQLEGPRYAASLETDDAGKAHLGLVGDGSFRFRAVQRSGREGESELELAGDSDLETVVIHVALPPR